MSLLNKSYCCETDPLQVRNRRVIVKWPVSSSFIHLKRKASMLAYIALTSFHQLENWLHIIPVTRAAVNSI